MATAQDLIDVAKKEIGTKESPPSSNKVKYNTAYYGRAVSGPDYPWCMVFMWWIFKEAGASDLFYGGGKTASCTELQNYAKRHGQYVTSNFEPGDVMFYQFDKDKNPDHTGILVEKKGSNYITIEGNTGSTSDADGGAVMQRTRTKGEVIGAYRPKYEEEVMDVKKLSDDDIIYIVTRYNKIVKNRPVGSVLKSDFEAAKKAGITDGSSPQGIPTRAQVASMVYRGMKEK